LRASIRLADRARRIRHAEFPAQFFRSLPMRD
jgi:hypothetical protein